VIAAPCPHVPGSASFVRGAHTYLVSLATCAVSAAPAPKHRGTSVVRSQNGHSATIRATPSEQTIVVDGRPVLQVHENRATVPGGLPGPLGLVTFSPDGRFLFYFVDPMSSASIAADGLVLRVLNVATGTTRAVTSMLMYSDYWSWCGSTLVLTAGGNRLATANKRLVVARPPDWRPKALWSDPSRAFGSVACSPDGASVAVLSQRAQSRNWNFFATRWQLWRVGLGGSRTRLDSPPAGYADESPAWSPDGGSLLFVRERKGKGTLELLRGGRTYGPLAQLGYSLGYYGHHAWSVEWHP
jgi:hypothetical protein